MQMLLFSVYLVVNPTKKRAFLAAGICISIIAYYVIGYKYNCFEMTNPVSVILYILAAFWLSSKSKEVRHPVISVIIGSLFVVISVGIRIMNMSLENFSFLSFIPLGGIGLSLIAFGARMNMISVWALSASTTSFGIYLSHVLFLEAFEYIEHKYWTGGIYYDLSSKLAVVSFIFIVSILFTLFIKRSLMLRKLLLGEGSRNKHAHNSTVQIIIASVY